MSEISNTPRRFIGCDVDEAKLVVQGSRHGHTRIVNNRRGSLAAFTKQLDPTRFVVCEATGGYEAGVLRTMLEAAVSIHRADARKVKAFIRSLGTLAETDRIDAATLAQRRRGAISIRSC
jgi:transposase